MFSSNVFSLLVSIGIFISIKDNFLRKQRSVIDLRRNRWMNISYSKDIKCTEPLGQAIP